MFVFRRGEIVNKVVCSPVLLCLFSEAANFQNGCYILMPCLKLELEKLKPDLFTFGFNFIDLVFPQALKLLSMPLSFVSTQLTIPGFLKFKSLLLGYVTGLRGTFSVSIDTTHEKSPIFWKSFLNSVSAHRFQNWNRNIKSTQQHCYKPPHMGLRPKLTLCWKLPKMHKKHVNWKFHLKLRTSTIESRNRIWAEKKNWRKTIFGLHFCFPIQHTA